MKITKYQPDKDGIIHINGVVRLLTMGIQENIVTLWAVTDPLDVAPVGKIPMRFKVLKDSDQVKIDDLENYITSFINKNGVWHLFAVKQKLTPVELKKMGSKPPIPPTPPEAGGRLGGR